MDGERAGAPGEVQHHDGRQKLRGEPHGEGDREEERFEERALERNVRGEDAHHEQQGDSRHEEPECPDAALEVRLGRALGEAEGDGPVARPDPCRGDHGASGAADDAGPEEDERVPVIVGRRARLTVAGRLERCRRLAGERRFVDVQVIRGDEPAVRRDDVPGRQGHDVAPDDVVDRYVLLASVADDRRPQRQAGLEGGDRRLGSGLLDEAEDRAQGDDGEDDPGLDRVADGDAHAARRHEDEDERAGELARGDPDQRAPPAVVQDVGAFGPQPGGGLRSGQPAVESVGFGGWGLPADRDHPGLS